MEISRSRGSRPLYIQVAEPILRAVESGDLRAGDRVSSEPELVRLHSVSRATASKALEWLERAGVVRREQGRGTFVEAPPLLQRTAALGSFSESIEQHRRVPSQRLLGFERVGAAGTGSLAIYFEDDDPLMRIERLRLVDDEPVGVHTHLLPQGVADAAGLDPGRFAAPDASLYALLVAAGMHVHGAGEHLRAIAAGPDDAAHLGVPAGEPLMRVVRASYDGQGRLLEVADARYLGERFDYSVALSPAAGHAGEVEQALSTWEGNHERDQAHGRGRAGSAGLGHGGRVR